MFQVLDPNWGAANDEQILHRCRELIQGLESNQGSGKRGTGKLDERGTNKFDECGTNKFDERGTGKLGKKGHCQR